MENNELNRKRRKKEIKLDTETMISVMQEIYNEANNLIIKSKQEMEERKKQVKVETTNDMYQLGKINNEALKVINDSINAKLTLVKLMSQTIFKKSDDVSEKITDNDLLAAHKMLALKREEKNKTYDIS